jgi:hypothetical protein
MIGPGIVIVAAINIVLPVSTCPFDAILLQSPPQRRPNKNDWELFQRTWRGFGVAVAPPANDYDAAGAKNGATQK